MLFKTPMASDNNQHEHLQQVPGQSAAASEERKRQHHWASQHALL